jgi:hypothetical protein
MVLRLFLYFASRRKEPLHGDVFPSRLNRGFPNKKYLQTEYARNRWGGCTLRSSHLFYAGRERRYGYKPSSGFPFDRILQSHKYNPSQDRRRDNHYTK